MATTFIQLATQSASTPFWEGIIESNWVLLDKYIGQTFTGGDPSAIDCEFPGQILIEITGGGDYVRTWVGTSVGTGNWITERKENYFWEATQFGTIVTDVMSSSTYTIDLLQSNFFQLTLNNSLVTLQSPITAAVLAAGFIIGTHTLTFQLEILQGADGNTLDFTNDWVFPFGGAKPIMSGFAGAKDFFFCTVRQDGKIHCGYNPNSSEG